MLDLLITLFILIISTTLATFVASRAWDYHPSRLFVLTVASLIVLSIFTLIRGDIQNRDLAYTIVAIIDLTMGVMSMTVLLLVSSLFMPQWWSGSYPIRWIALPYVLAIGVLFIDLVARTGWFVEGVSLEHGIYRSDVAMPGGIILLTLLTVGWLVVFIMLVVAAWLGKHQVRTVAALLAGTMLLTMVGGIVMIFMPVLGRTSNIVLSIPIIMTLTYAVLRTRLLTPTRAALDLALQALHEVVIVLDQDTTVVYTNPSATAIGIQRNCPLNDTLDVSSISSEDRQVLNASIACSTSAMIPPFTIAGRRIIFSYSPVHNRHGVVVGTLLLGRDVTELEKQTEQLAQEQAQLQSTVRQLEQEQRRRNELAATVRALSLPVIPVLKGVLVLPLIGNFDQERMDEFLTILLKNIERQSARLVLIDITGLPALDAAGAAGLLRGVDAASLLGARCILVGVRPEIAASLVSLGVSLDGLESAATLEQILPTVITEGVR